MRAGTIRAVEAIGAVYAVGGGGAGASSVDMTGRDAGNKVEDTEKAMKQVFDMFSGEYETLTTYDNKGNISKYDPNDSARLNIVR